MELTFISLFAGIGGLDLGLERAGLRCVAQVENNPACRELLSRYWPEVSRYGDIRVEHTRLAAADVVVGGDPCPKHSRARSNGASRSPDLSGYFLAVVGRLRPRWVVRENVPAPTVDGFDACLAALGYGTAVVRLDAAAVTGQSRQRDFVIGLYQASRSRLRDILADCSDGSGPYTTRLDTRAVAPALTTHRTRYDSRDCYIWHPGAGLRILDGDERDALAGFPAGWTAGFSEATRARMCGNAVVPQVAEYIGRCLIAHATATEERVA
jgi:DNA (cytosine-5)-methyltransferase 1